VPANRFVLTLGGQIDCEQVAKSPATVVHNPSSRSSPFSINVSRRTCNIAGGRVYVLSSLHLRNCFPIRMKNGKKRL